METQNGHEVNPRSGIAKRLSLLFPHGCKKVLLVMPPNVPEEDFDPSVAIDRRYPVFPTTGLAFLAKFLQKRGYEKKICDLNFQLMKNFLDDPEHFVYTVWREWLLEILIAFKPDIVVVTCMFTLYYREMKRVARFVKEYDATLPVIAGGVHISDAAEIVAEDCSDIDIIGLFEGNASFPDMLDVVNKKMGEEKLTQLGMMIDGKYEEIRARAAKTHDAIDDIPDYDALPVGEYSNYGRIGTYHSWMHPETKAGTVLSNIGCRAQCTFCSVRYFNGRGVFTRNVPIVADDIQFLKEHYDVTHIMFLDDDLLYDPARTLELFNEIVRRNLHITWCATNGIIASAVTEENARAMYESGCIGLSIGIESGSPKILKEVKKPSGLKHFYRCAEILKQYPSIFTKSLLMCGFPGETIGQVLETVKLAVEIGLDWNTTQPLNLIPGVPITNEALIAGLISKQELVDGTERPFVGSTGGQERRVRQEKKHAREFEDPLEWDPQRVPTREEVKDVWFSLDYRTNYPKLFAEQNPIKLDLLRKWFTNIFDHTHKESGLGQLSFGILEYRLGNIEEAKRRWKLARTYVESSAFWKIRFEALALYDLFTQCENACEGTGISIPKSFYEKFRREMGWLNIPESHLCDISPAKGDLT